MKEASEQPTEPATETPTDLTAPPTTEPVPDVENSAPPAEAPAESPPVEASPASDPEPGIPELTLAEKEFRSASAFCQKAKDKYFEYVNQALRLWDMTRSDGWTGMYKAAIQQHRKIVDNAVSAIDEAVDQIATAENSESLEKAIKDQVKILTSERERHTAWFTRTVFPISKIAEDAKHVKENVNRGAREKASFNELTESALPGNVAKITASWPKIEWDDDAGVLYASYS